MKILFTVIALFACLTASAHPAVELATANADELIIELPNASGAQRQVLLDDFVFLKEKGSVPADVVLLVKTKGVDAATIHSKLIVVGEKLAKLSRIERLFILAHEGSHARHADRERKRELLSELIPSFLRDWEISARYTEIQPQLTELSHSHEFRADRDASKALSDLGVSYVLASKKLFSHASGSVSHPADSVRLAKIEEFSKQASSKRTQ